MPHARVSVVSPVLVQVLVEEAGEWRPALLVRGLDAEPRAQDLRRLLEAGLVAPAAALCDPCPGTVAVEDLEPHALAARAEVRR